ncbi:winged helix-turn-helix domain-containing protein [Pseudoalteromonas luteoviolacea]|uniref:Transcriptional regulator n=1 Tax=Pseudoalteromonas luteoviolacea S4054 TaxID=1129367 RepID=A0A0F6A6X6_9GAMM|nr:winged helix-turn-helix domain-containing protein [Pseudoalteromonas luteoviolacea]AOT11014.1 hypothetical protein S4054249_24565 [Pseudoalteromonas luteoviolacea]AOT15822.1 hypothetical protein S40542_23945 [Pseudoalteromonas luteoviolacea]AOT20835.1 hypothetical protein S4054_24485 [Pseudoalteromonas luteoviolacea]KKE81915.1 hypothetical protein N479_21000 [Pseudoalteromonas luteoviolacea S4054]KZN72246.1 hypothetical protein N481_16295 [Pseudoalteromonas luteoviolacea S4047-1]
MAKVLLVERDNILVDKLVSAIHNEGHQCYRLTNEKCIVDWVLLNRPDLVVLDKGSLQDRALSLCCEIHHLSDTLLIMTSRSDQVIDQLIALESGADDYIKKPYCPEELVSRINAMILRLQKLALVTHRLQLIEHGFKVKFADKEVQLTQVEFYLFRLLHEQPYKVLTREDISRQIYNDHRVVSENTVNSHVRNLRRKLKAISPHHMLIASVYSAGYKYQPCLDQK